MKRIKKTLRRLNRRRKGIHFNTSDIASNPNIKLTSLKSKSKKTNKMKTKMKTNSTSFGNLPQHSLNNPFEGMKVTSNPSSLKEPSFNLGPKTTAPKKTKRLSKRVSRTKKPSKDLTQKLSSKSNSDNSPFGNLPQHTFNNPFEGMKVMSNPSSLKEPSFNLGSYKAPKDTFSKKVKKMKSSLSKGLSKRFKKPSKDLTQGLLASNAFIPLGSKKGRKSRKSRKRRTKRLKKKRKSRSRKN